MARGRVGRSTATISPTPRVAPTTVAPRASEPVSRRAATTTRVAPRNASVVGIKASGSTPPFKFTSARRHANPIASISARATSSAAKAREAGGRGPRPRAARGRGPCGRGVGGAMGDDSARASRRGGEAYELRGRRYDELRRFGIGLDPVLLVRRDVDEIDRVEARRGLVELRLELAEACRRLPVDLLSRVAAAVRPHAAEAKGIRHPPATRGGLRERP